MLLHYGHQSLGHLALIKGHHQRSRLLRPSRLQHIQATGVTEKDLGPIGTGTGHAIRI